MFNFRVDLNARVSNFAILLQSRKTRNLEPVRYIETQKQLIIPKIINAYQSGCVSCLGNKSYFPFCDNIYCVIQSLQSLWNISKIIKKTTTIKSEESSKTTSGLSYYLVGFFF